MADELNIEELLVFSFGEKIEEFASTADAYNKYHCIVQEKNDDIDAALEDTLGRILDAGGTEEDVYRILGAEIPGCALRGGIRRKVLPWDLPRGATLHGPYHI